MAVRRNTRKKRYLTGFALAAAVGITSFILFLLVPGTKEIAREIREFAANEFACTRLIEKPEDEDFPVWIRFEADTPKVDKVIVLASHDRSSEQPATRVFPPRSGRYYRSDSPIGWVFDREPTGVRLTRACRRVR